ncbi:hybrid sensor histidine kinase/response regulator [Bradyrhizobium japonicum]|uniref:hybrid sensor histidine kinase/response regulator n=1 Tax=Bradyrhizobium japonicum TaxID=375 RepID=UPI002A1295D2|nr:PAS domain S-box-containing protein [Bradyrhizobium japonicum]MCP1794461.1 PAS domain S-box-containing protein [Bradyrhizobium japonicum]MCP1811272.1 PAS domain S-box-containing protein [Bradyrhizobium japonicum]MCP1821363.1 PAS domain S-box-containing protein [Bradyrhizobium japonicum]MCP1876398.1 PAS domain S-box-containing protein [Bradyrhizobium japonicum]
MDGKKKFEASQSAEGRYRMLVEAVTDYAIYMLDPTGIVSSWNPGARRFKGYEESEIIGEHFSRFYTEEDRKSELPRRALETAAREGKFEAEGWRVRKDGSRFWAYVIIDPIKDSEGKLVGYAKVTRDLTERRAAEAELRRSQEQFRLLVQGVTDYAIYLLRAEGKVASWNAGAERIKGYKPEEIIGQHFSVFYTNDDRSSGLPKLALATARQDGRFEKEGLRVRKDGSQFWANVVLDAIHDEEGALIGFAKITRDVTERKKTEEKLDRTREALVQAQKMEAIGHLTGGVAHDFNNLLMAIQGSLELMKRRLPAGDTQMHQFLDNALQGAQRGAALTQRMLAFARRQELKLQTINVTELVNGMTELLQSSLGSSAQIETHFSIGLPKVAADANQLELAILNLTMNARDAMPKGGTIVISARERTVHDEPGLKPGGYVCLAVKDTGTGMDEETVRRATEPFYTTKGVGKGTGLGLPMVLGMTEQSGGKLYLKSKPGEGTTVELCLPVAASETDEKQECSSPTAAPVTRTLRIVSVDDDPLVAFNTLAMLEELGHTVFAATSGAEALGLIKKGDIDLLITDQAMPGMTGSELAEAVRSDWPDLPIIIATGYAELPEGPAQALRRLAKPFFEQDLAQAIASVSKLSATA